VVNLSKLLVKQFGFMLNSGITQQRIILTGPAAGSKFTPQIIEKVIGLRVECFNELSASAYGATVLARRIKI
jgi:sugar (pentulose or hexulose) kinase